MANEVKPVTEGSSSEIKEVFPYLRVKNAAAAIEFYTQAFGAKELFRLTETRRANRARGAFPRQYHAHACRRVS
jgi:uncharacterized glyoxalase superfamily protein PhnB